MADVFETPRWRKSKLLSCENPMSFLVLPCLIVFGTITKVLCYINLKAENGGIHVRKSKLAVCSNMIGDGESEGRIGLNLQK